MDDASSAFSLVAFALEINNRHVCDRFLKVSTTIHPSLGLTDDERINSTGIVVSY